MVNGAKHWSFTTNNPTDDDFFTTLPIGFLYLVVGREVSTTGTPHLQGAFGLESRKTLAYLRRNIPELSRSHLTISRKPAAAVQYCKKSEHYEEFGDFSSCSSQGKRSDIEQFMLSVRGGSYDYDQLREDHPLVFAKYPRFVTDYISHHKPKAVPESYPLYEWQETLSRDLLLPPSDRPIVFVVDLVGNSGKSWFADWFTYHNPNCQIILPGKKADMSYALKENNRVLFIDAPRSKQGEFIQYDFLEEVKNKRIFSGKYESRMKNLDPCHVVVLMNEEPDMTKLSLDRFDIRRI